MSQKANHKRTLDEANEVGEASPLPPSKKFINETGNAAPVEAKGDASATTLEAPSELSPTLSPATVDTAPDAATATPGVPNGGNAPNENPTAALTQAPSLTASEDLSTMDASEDATAPAVNSQDPAWFDGLAAASPPPGGPGAGEEDAFGNDNDAVVSGGSGEAATDPNVDQPPPSLVEDPVAKKIKAGKVAAANKKKNPAAAKKKKKAQTNPKLKVEDALAYLAKVKMEFDRKPHIYTKFLDIMKNFKAHAVDTPGVIKQVSHLFKGHDNLILGFNTFLPEDQRISLASLKEMNKKEELAKRNRKKAAAQRKMKKDASTANKTGAAAGKGAVNASVKTSPATQGNTPFGFEHAITYVTKIKRRFQHQPEIYKQFLDILHLYKEHEQSIEGVLDSVSDLFRDEPDLLKEFAYFLPEAVQQQAKERLSIAVQRSKQRQKDKRQVMKKGVKLGIMGGKKSLSGGALLLQKKEEKKEEKKMPLIEKRFFKRVKAALGQQNLWMEFLKCLELYSKEVLNKGEFLSLVSDVLSTLPSDEGEQFIEELEAALEKRVVVQEMEDETWLSMPASEIDLSQCRRSTPSYRHLPRNYPRPSCSMRSALCESVLNNNWVSVPTGSAEDNAFKNLRRNVFEEALFKCEDDRYEMDMVVDANKATIRRLGPIAEEIARLKESGQPLYQFRLDKRALGVIHLKSIARIYGGSGNEVLELLRKNPAGAIPVILERCKEKALEWGGQMKGLNEQWKDVLEKNYQKSLDHRSYYFKQTERKAIMSKTLLQEIKTMKDRVKHHEIQANAGKKMQPKKTETAVVASKELLTKPQLVYAYPDLEAHQDAFKIIMHAAKSGNIEGCVDDINNLEVVFRDLVGRFFGLPADFSRLDKLQASGTRVSASNAHTVGTQVTTPYGTGVVKEFCEAVDQEASAQCYIVTLPFGDAFLSTCNVHPVGAGSTLTVKTEELATQMYVGNDIYVFFRLYQMLYTRLRKAKELCRNASALNTGKVSHWSDRSHGPIPATPGAGPAQNVADLAGNVLLSPRAMALSVGHENDGPGTPTKNFGGDSSSGDTSFGPTRSASDEAKEQQLRSRDLYFEFLKSIYGVLSESVEQANYEDLCRSLMGASTASYMLFTLDKLIRNVVRSVNNICSEDVNITLMELYDYEMNGTSIFHKRYERNAKIVISNDMQEHLFIISCKGGILAPDAPKGGAHGPGVWQESMPWQRIPQMGFELIGLGSQLRSEMVMAPSDMPAQEYIKSYMSCSSISAFNTSQPRWVFCGRNKQLVKRWLDENRATDGGDKKEGRDRRARERAASVRNAHAWTMGKIHVNDGLKCKLTLNDYRLHYVTGSEDFFYRIYANEKNGDDDDEDKAGTSSDSETSSSDDSKKKDKFNARSMEEIQKAENARAQAERRSQAFLDWTTTATNEILFPPTPPTVPATVVPEDPSPPPASVATVPVAETAAAPAPGDVTMEGGSLKVEMPGEEPPTSTRMNIDGEIESTLSIESL
jgi:paired amphipathic helix protein Sin3a